MTDEMAADSEAQLAKGLSRSQLLLATGDTAGAEKLARGLVEQYPESTSVHEHLGDVYYAKGKSAQARRHYKRALQLEPANADAERKFATALLNVSQDERRRQMVRELTSGTNDYRLSARRPLNAALAALLFPGLGQLHNRQHEKGLAIFAAAAILIMMLFYGLVLNPWEIVARQSPDKSLTFHEQAHLAREALSHMPGSYWALLICGAIAYLAGYAYCIYDAYVTAREQATEHRALGV